MRKVGDKVVINPCLKVGIGTNDNNYVVEDMFAYMGLSTEITRSLDNGETYQLACDNGEWYWPDEALLPMSNAENIRHMNNEELADFILSINSPKAEWNNRENILEWLSNCL